MRDLQHCCQRAACACIASCCCPEANRGVTCARSVTHTGQAVISSKMHQYKAAVQVACTCTASCCRVKYQNEAVGCYLRSCCWPQGHWGHPPAGCGSCQLRFAPGPAPHCYAPSAPPRQRLRPAPPAPAAQSCLAESAAMVCNVSSSIPHETYRDVQQGLSFAGTVLCT